METEDTMSMTAVAEALPLVAVSAPKLPTLPLPAGWYKEGEEETDEERAYVSMVKTLAQLGFDGGGDFDGRKWSFQRGFTADGAIAYAAYTFRDRYCQVFDWRLDEMIKPYEKLAGLVVGNEELKAALLQAAQNARSLQASFKLISDVGYKHDSDVD